MATTFFLHMSLGFVTIVIAAIGLLGLYTVSNEKHFRVEWIHE